MLKEPPPNVFDRVLHLFLFLEVHVDAGSFNVEGIGKRVDEIAGWVKDVAVCDDSEELIPTFPAESPVPELDSPDFNVDVRFVEEDTPARKQIPLLFFNV